jgi:hypothetical protein
MNKESYENPWITEEKTLISLNKISPLYLEPKSFFINELDYVDLDEELIQR